MTSTTLSRDQPPPTGTPGVTPRDLSSSQVEATPTSEEAVRCLSESEILLSLNELIDSYKECIEVCMYIYILLLSPICHCFNNYFITV